MLETPLPPGKSAARLARARLSQVTFGSGRVLGSMYTDPHPVGLAAYQAFPEANLGNSRLYPGVAELEQQLLEWLGDLMAMPGEGLITSGATEANVMALWAAREARPERKVVLYGANAHFSLPKAIDLLGLEGRIIPLDREFTLDTERLREAAGDDTLAIVGQAGSTELGLCDDLQVLGEVAEEAGAHYHVDAAFGGFILPFLSGPPQWSRLGHGADTLAVDPHKLGRAPIPAGAFLVRDADLLRKLARAAPYLTRESQVGVLGPRCSAGVAGAWATVAAMGRQGYRRQARACIAATAHLVAAMAELDLAPVVEPPLNIAAFGLPGVREVQQRLMDEGWYPSRVAKPEALRLVVMPHVTPGIVDRFVERLGIQLKTG